MMVFSILALLKANNYDKIYSNHSRMIFLL